MSIPFRSYTWPPRFSNRRPETYKRNYDKWSHDCNGAPLKCACAYPRRQCKHLCPVCFGAIDVAEQALLLFWRDVLWYVEYIRQPANSMLTQL